MNDDMHVIQNSWYMDLGYEWLPNILTPSVVKAIPYNMFCILFCNFFGILQSMLQHCNRLIWLSHGLLIPMVRLNKPDMMPSLPKRYNLVFTIPKFG